ncbi:MAG: T9SS type A sorting domain-containing protein [Sphingobacteriales bacterium]|nr:T9SS type A sorting domain-containing protein [Sphingobacteriales bacterium]
MRRIIICVVSIFFCAAAFAQQAVTNSGNLQIYSGASITGFGNFTNNSSAVLVNNGSLYVKGNITNDQSSMSAGTGTLYLNGSSAQSLGGAQAFKTYNLETNNSSGITLNINLSVSGAHTFTAGLVTTSATPNYLIYESGSSHSGSADSRHVNGWVKKTGSSNFTFPAGDATYLRSIAISSLSASSEFNCRYYTPTTNTNNLSSPIVKVKANEYWQLNQVSGGTAQVTLNWDHSKVAMDNVLLADILASLYTGGLWTDGGGSASGNVTTTGTITSGATGTFGPFTLGYKSFPVPLKLLSFSAVRRSGISYLNWVTDNEYNVDRFEVQRSYDGSNFSVLGNVSARNSGTRESYNYEDPSPLRGIAYYRIRSVDVDGRFSYSRIAAVSEYDDLTGSFVVLNPAHDGITILNRSGKSGVYDYKVYSPAGQLIISGKVNMENNGGAWLPLPASIAAGIYTLDIQNAETRFRQQILIEK